MSAREVAFENEILRGVVGSTAHGLNIDDQSDRDEMGVFIEPPQYVCGLSPCEHYIHRDKPEGVRSEPGDLDLTLYSLRKFCRLAEQGNPSVVVLLWLSEHNTKTPLGAALIELREAFISREAGQRFLGYLVAQKMRMKGERARTVSRPDLVERYGFDTKYASHALRLAYDGIELLTHRRLTLPAPEPRLSILRGIKTGKFTEAEALDKIEEAEAALRLLADSCAWQTDRKAINDFLARAHQQHWRQRGWV